MIELKALQGQVKYLVDDLREQVAAMDEFRSELEQEWKQARTAQRTAGTFESWLEDVLDQAAVAWVLGCVFVRFCEDNALIKRVWIGGPTEVAPAERAIQERQGYLIANPTHNDRHWLRAAFAYLAELRPTRVIFDHHNLIWRFAISGRAAEALSDFFRRGDGCASLESSELNTRFLGDLYQNLSVHAREHYALLQTPEFVEEFILDRAFEPAYREFGLMGSKVIDPTCGSGHFLLGAFKRLFTRWKEREPDTAVGVLVQRALDQVSGVDINPFAIAIARFRLMIAALEASRLKDLESAPAYNLRLAVGDSLLEWGLSSRHQGDLIDVLQGESGFAYFTEDADMLAEILENRQYTVVVGNPPYIAVKDKALDKKYREIYPQVCHRQYQLTAPFAERFFRLAKRGDADGQGAGWVGQITGNGFMKREFGVKLINDYFAHEIELTEVMDLSGAYISGHGTPTVILIGRSNDRGRSSSIRAALMLRGGPAEPKDPASGPFWRALVDQIDSPGSSSEWINVEDLDRNRFAKHPWSLTGGGAVGLMELLGSASSIRLKSIVESIGFMAVTREDDAYLLTRSASKRFASDTPTQSLVAGEVVRDYAAYPEKALLFPYKSGGDSAVLGPRGSRWLWPCRPHLAARKALSGTQQQRGLTWFEYSDFKARRWSAPRKIGFAYVATHNHFVLERGDSVYIRTAPVISLPAGATEEESLRLIGLLNSSTACFWLKQVSHSKGNATASSGMPDQPWSWNWEFTGTKLQEFPLPESYPVALSRLLDDLARKSALCTPRATTSSEIPSRSKLLAAREEWISLRAQMVSAQEELDWLVYSLYGLTDEDFSSVRPPELTPGERAFEIVLARLIKSGQAKSKWFTHHNLKPITELPDHWSDEYRSLVERRIQIIESDINIALIEVPECKRRWTTKGWDAMQAGALRDWLLDRLEEADLWGAAPTPLSVAQLADRLRHDEAFRSVLDLWVGSDQHDLTKTLGRLVADEYVPYLSSLRYKPSGIRKRLQWEQTWELQRREDLGEDVDIPLPPKYGSGDFLKPSYLRHRGKLDIPKERFISYQNAGRDGDPTLLLGWAGWDHLAQAQALATVYLDRKNQAAWKKEALLPLLAGLAELEPWLKQWHDEPRPGFPGSPAQFFTSLIDTELALLGADRAELTLIRGLG